MIQIFEYEGQQIEFDLSNQSVMINATEMAKIYNANIGHFFENDSTKKFVNACLNNRNSDYLGIRKLEDLYVSKQRTGTWMHRVLALKFASWLDPNFEIWIYSTIDKLIFGNIKESVKSKIEIKQRLDELNNKFLLDPEYLEYTNLVSLDKSLSRSISKHQKAQLNLFLPNSTRK